MHSVCTVSSESVKTPVIVKLQLWQCWERKINNYDLRYACVIFFSPSLLHSSSLFSCRYLKPGSCCKSKEFFLLFFSLIHFTFRPYLKAFPISHFEPALPAKSGSASTGGHALMPLWKIRSTAPPMGGFGSCYTGSGRISCCKSRALPPSFESPSLKDEEAGEWRSLFHNFLPQFVSACSAKKKSTARRKKSFGFCLVWRPFKIFPNTPWLLRACMSVHCAGCVINRVAELQLDPFHHFRID